MAVVLNWDINFVLNTILSQFITVWTRQEVKFGTHQSEGQWLVSWNWITELTTFNNLYESKLYIRKIVYWKKKKD